MLYLTSESLVCRLGDGTDRVQVGAVGAYVARCRSCFVFDAEPKTLLPLLTPYADYELEHVDSHRFEPPGLSRK